jgi:hypothetical protein
VGATIVEREYLTFVPAKQHRTIGSVHCYHLLFLQVGERCGAKESCKIRRSAKGSHSQEDNSFIRPARGLGAPAASDPGNWEAWEGIKRTVPTKADLRRHSRRAR